MQEDTSHDAEPASDQEMLQAAWNQLNLVLGFFPRIDTRLSAILAIDLGMLALAGSRWPVRDDISLRIAIVAIFFALPLAFSFRNLWDAIVPNTGGGTNSLVYYNSVACMSESAFRDRYMKLSPKSLACDLLEQTWRNAKILQCKFESLRIACISMAFAVPPWIWLLIELPERVLQ